MHFTLDNLSVCLRKNGKAIQLVHDLSFAIAAGEFFALVGESGSGKSITCHALMNLLGERMSVAGQASLGGKPLFGSLASTRDRRADLAMVFQNPTLALNPVRTIGFQLMETLVVSQDVATKKLARQKACALLEQVGLFPPGDIMRFYPHQLSGGMNQRVMIALALARRPKLLIADEPTSALDVTVQAQIISLIDRLRKEHDMAVLFVTHDLALAKERSDRIGVLHQGHLVEQGKPNEVFFAPRHAYTKRLLGAMLTLGSGQLRESTDRVTAPVDGRFKQTEADNGQALTLGAPGILVENVTFAYPTSTWGLRTKTPANRVLDGVSFKVRRGEAIGLVGESGSGKSTLAKLLLDFERPNTGRIEFFGRAQTDFGQKEYRCMIQPVFQNPVDALDPRKTIGDQLCEPLRVLKLCAKEAMPNRIKDLLEQVGLLPDLASRMPHQISGGQAQRVAIARALAVEPQILVCDEAVSALDMSIQSQILDLLKTLQQQLGLTYLFISHDFAAVAYLCDRLFVLNRGKIVEQGPTKKVLEAPSHAYTQQLLAAVPGGAAHAIKSQPLAPSREAVQ